MALELSEDAMRKLRAFAAAGRSATPLNVPDQQRFVAFVVAAHKENPELAPNEVGVWCRQNGWSDERAETMADWVEGAFMVLDAQSGRLA